MTGTTTPLLHLACRGRAGHEDVHTRRAHRVSGVARGAMADCNLRQRGHGTDREGVARGEGHDGLLGEALCPGSPHPQENRDSQLTYVLSTVVVLVTVGVCAATAWVHRLLEQYVLPAPSGQVAHAKHYRVTRRHLESLKSWENRTGAAARALHAASDAFVAEAQKLGRMERVSRAGLKWSLPSTHPLAVALVAARYPDGPPQRELHQIAIGEVTEVGVDLALV